MTTYRSNVRDSHLTALSDRVAKNNYDRYLKRVVLRRVRSFEEREITFDFPVTAIVGPNGGGKTTILGAAAIAYRQVPPGRFFAKSGKYDDSMADWKIEYDLIDRSLQRVSVQRTASFRRAKWNRSALPRDVYIFGVTRTVPATERKELVKAIGSKFAAQSEIQLSGNVIDAVQVVLGKPMEGYRKLSVDIGGKVTLYSTSTAAGSYSEFHFGAGEASVLKMISEIEEAPDYSLILIEEIENGLHPVATRRMVEYLMTVARTRGAQVIFTTHSNDALAPLPTNAIWAAYNGEVLQGKLDVAALRTITGQVDAQLAIYVEDEFAELLVKAALRTVPGVHMDAIKVHGMGGAQPAIDVNRQRNRDPASTFPSICILDGDQRSRRQTDPNVHYLPGDTYPEEQIFGYVLSHLDRLAARLTLMLQLPLGQQEWVKKVVNERSLDSPDRHSIFEAIGEDLGFISGLIVKNAFINAWTQDGQEVGQFLDQFLTQIPATRPAQS